MGDTLGHQRTTNQFLNQRIIINSGARINFIGKLTQLAELLANRYRNNPMAGAGQQLFHLLTHAKRIFEEKPV